MQAHPISVGDVLAGQKQYVVPVFQRSYEWGEDRWESLWQDLNAIAEESDLGFTHFIGPMVVISNAFPHDVPRFLVIDGQQRLMTLSVLIAAIRDRANNLHFINIAKAIDNSNALSFLNTKGDSIPKIVPRLRDRETLSNILNSKIHDSDSTFLLAQAYKYFYNQISDITPPQPSLFGEKPDSILDRLYKAVLQRLQVVMITLGHGDNPSNIYESLNFKHETLTDADLIRNYVFMQLKTLEEQEQFDSAYWRPFEDIFNGIDPTKQKLTDFFYRYLISKTEYLARRRLYTSFTDYVNEFLKSKKLADLVSELSRYAKYFLAIVDKCPDGDIEVAFERFRLLDTDTAIPLIMSMYDSHANQNSPDAISKATFLRMLRITESFILRRSIMRERTRGYGLDFALACKKAQSIESLQVFYGERGWPTNEHVREALNTFEFYLREPKKCRLVLMEIEKSFGHKEKVMLSDKHLTIEHVMPQNLTKSWREMLGRGAEQKHQKFLHTLGNLTLTGYNLELGDKPFSEKRLEFSKSNLSLNEYFSGIDKWGEGEIRNRTGALCDRLIDLWDRP
jgi:hypothetical protein